MKNCDGLLYSLTICGDKLKSVDISVFLSFRDYLLMSQLSGTVDRASVSWLREPGFESGAALSNLGQVCSLYIAPVYSAV